MCPVWRIEFIFFPLLLLTRQSDKAGVGWWSLPQNRSGFPIVPFIVSETNFLRRAKYSNLLLLCCNKILNQLSTTKIVYRYPMNASKKKTSGDNCPFVLPLKYATFRTLGRLVIDKFTTSVFVSSHFIV